MDQPAKRHGALRCMAGQRARTRRSGRCADASAVADWAIERLGDGPGLVAIDAPTIIRNETGMRPCEREMHRRFGRYHAGCYPANLGSRFASTAPSAFRRASRRRASRTRRESPQIQPLPGSRYSPRGLNPLLFINAHHRYKKGTVAQRRAGLLQFQFLLCECLATREPRVMPFQLPPVPGNGGAILKAHEDRLDAILCAYIGAWWWYSRAQTCGPR
ncbi:MAG: DUF429 domain-containing protein [Bryobacterales bacterium]|nr:DUF429 domain-containing protein [Bryobacterales bacterium]